jgi:hypothetical protein
MSNRSVRFHPFLVHAVKHGAFAKTAILPGEDPQEFEELHSALIEEWAPVGPTEEDAVLSIAKGVWRKGRAQKFLHAEIETCRFDREHPLYNEAQELRKLLSIMETGPFLYLIETAPDLFERGLGFAIESAVPDYIARDLEETCPRKNFESASAWLQALRNRITSVLLPACELYGEGPDELLGQSAKVLTPEVVKNELAVDERIDAMIDRAIKRLVQTKAMKQMLVGTSPDRGGDQPKKIQSGKSKESGKGANR